jgi:hypothetical protein
MATVSATRELVAVAAMASAAGRIVSLGTASWYLAKILVIVAIMAVSSSPIDAKVASDGNLAAMS